jgi:hypothetical protein
LCPTMVGEAVDMRGSFRQQVDTGNNTLYNT